MCLVCSALNLSIKRNAYQVNFIFNSPLLFHVKVSANLKGFLPFNVPTRSKFSASLHIIVSLQLYFSWFLLAVVVDHC